MTDEEMAERYVKENGKVYYHSNGEPIFTREEDLKFAFLAGLKAGRPEWHKVADGDLPKVNELVLIKITGCFVLGWTNGTNWFNDSNNGTIIDRRMVYAWKEIVLPKEIEND